MNETKVGECWKEYFRVFGQYEIIIYQKYKSTYVDNLKQIEDKE